jgi:hypothetical protein
MICPFRDPAILSGAAIRLFLKTAFKRWTG